MFTNFRFWWNTKIRPRFVSHYWCEFWDWREKKKTVGWYILNREGDMIPWVHFDQGLICLYENMITKIAPPIN